MLLSAHGGFSARGVGDIAVQLLLPFAAGQLARPWIGAWVGRNKRWTSLVDRGSILLVVYVAFSEGVTHGIWHQLDVRHFATLLLLDGVLLAAILLATTVISRALGFSRPDQITVVFCGSKKSLAAGLPMASVLFAGQSLGLVVLPLMLFHQLQLMVCATLARRYAAGPRRTVGRWRRLLPPPDFGPPRHRGGLPRSCQSRNCRNITAICASFSRADPPRAATYSSNCLRRLPVPLGAPVALTEVTCRANAS